MTGGTTAAEGERQGPPAANTNPTRSFAATFSQPTLVFPRNRLPSPPSSERLTFSKGHSCPMGTGRTTVLVLVLLGIAQCAVRSSINCSLTALFGCVPASQVVGRVFCFAAGNGRLHVPQRFDGEFRRARSQCKSGVIFVRFLQALSQDDASQCGVSRTCCSNSAGQKQGCNFDNGVCCSSSGDCVPSSICLMSSDALSRIN